MYMMFQEVLLFEKRFTQNKSLKYTRGPFSDCCGK